MGPEDLSHGVAQPRPAASSAASKVAGILVEKRRENRLRHVIADYKIPICRAEIPAKSSGTLSKRSVCVGQLAFASEQDRQRDSTAIESIFGGYLELLARCQWLVTLQAWRGSVVGNDPQNPLALVRRVVILTRLCNRRLSRIDW